MTGIDLRGEIRDFLSARRARITPEHDVQFHRSGQKRLSHPVVGQFDLDFESLELPSEPGLQLNVYTAATGTPTADALRLLASWAASETNLRHEAIATR